MRYREDMSPQPRSHIKTLMRIGYDLNSAIADIIDNSITAKATKIYITSPSEADKPFISIVDTGSIVAAAEQLQQTPSGLSRALNRLEKKLQVTLLERTTRKLKLTQEGRLFLDKARSILAELAEAEDALLKSDSDTSGLILSLIHI